MENIVFYFFNLINSPVNIPYFNANSYFNGFTNHPTDFYMNTPNILNSVDFPSLAVLLPPHNTGAKKSECACAVSKILKNC